MDSLRDADLLESFDILEDDHQALLLRTYQKIDETQAHCIISIIMSSDSAYSLIYYVFAKLADFSKQSTIIEFLNKLNNDSILMKYYIDEQNHIVGAINYIGIDTNFNSSEFINLMEIGFSEIIDAYNKYIHLLNYHTPEFVSNASEFHVTLWNLNFENEVVGEITPNGIPLIQEFVKESGEVVVKEFVKEESKFAKEFVKAGRDRKSVV